MPTSQKTGLARGLTHYGDPDFALYLRRSFARSMGYSDAMLARPSGFNNCHRHLPEQKADAERAIAEQGEKGVSDAPVVTEVVPLEKFWPGETYHQDYYENNPRQRYCQIVIAPKVAKFRKQHLQRLKR